MCLRIDVTRGRSVGPTLRSFNNLFAYSFKPCTTSLWIVFEETTTFERCTSIISQVGWGEMKSGMSYSRKKRTFTERPMQ